MPDDEVNTRASSSVDLLKAFSRLKKSDRSLSTAMSSLGKKAVPEATLDVDVLLVTLARFHTMQRAGYL